MKMTPERRAIDKIYRRRDRYEIPDWQRGEVWDKVKKQKLIDSILKGWKLPKFYFVKVSEDDYLVEDGQQRLVAIYEFFSNELQLSSESSKEFGGHYYRELPRRIADTFDDFEIEYDVIENASDEDLKEFFQRLQEGMSLNSSEKLNAVHSKLRDFCRTSSKHKFFSETIAVKNTRYAHFDIMAKVVSTEIEGLDTGLRLEDVKQVFLANSSFSATSAVARRINAALDFANVTFQQKGTFLRTRTIIQSVLTLAIKLVGTGRSQGLEKKFADFMEQFTDQLAEQVEMGQAATDSDYLTFQNSVNANVRGSAKLRQQILLRKLLLIAPELADSFDPTIVAEAGVSERIKNVGDSIARLVEQINRQYSGKHGEDLFKATNKTSSAITKLTKRIKNLAEYQNLVDDLYFLFKESVGTRLKEPLPTSFANINQLRVDLRHDLDHGEASKVRSKRKKVAGIFESYSGVPTPDALPSERFPLVQATLLGAVEGDLRALLVNASSL